MKPARIVLHCTVTPNGKKVNVEAMEKNHQERGFKGIGYHFLIQPDGAIVETRPVDQVGAHVKGHNTGSLGIALAGTDKFTPEQFTSLRELAFDLYLHHHLEKWAFYCHYQFDTAQAQGKTCPNIEINRLLVWYLWKDDKAIEPYLLTEAEVQ